METLSIEERINRLEDIEAIKTLTARYSNCINQGWNNKKIDVKGITQLFTKDAVWESTDMNISVHGIDKIVTSLIKETQNLRFAMHNYCNPIIEINKTKATGNWLFWVASQVDENSINQVYMSQDITYEKIRGEWLIKAIRLDFGTLIKNNTLTEL
jgi:hypothetical protein